MQEIQSAKHIIHYGHDMPLREGVGLESEEDAVQIHIDAIHYEEDIVEGLLEASWRFLGWNQNIAQSWREYVIFHLSQLTHNHYLSKYLSTLVAVREYVTY